MNDLNASVGVSLCAHPLSPAPRYGSLHLDCRLKTHLAVPPVVNPGQHYDDPLLNPVKERFIPTWQASQL